MALDQSALRDAIGIHVAESILRAPHSGLFAMVSLHSLPGERYRLEFASEKRSLQFMGGFFDCFGKGPPSIKSTETVSFHPRQNTLRKLVDKAATAHLAYWHSRLWC